MHRTRLKIQLVKHEGDKRKPYQDTEGHWTIGVGRNLEAKPLSDAVVALMLDEDINEARATCQHIFPGFDTLSEGRQHALIDMAFNLGPPRLRKFVKMIAAINARDFETAASEAIHSKWATQVGDRAQTIASLLRAEGAA